MVGDSASRRSFLQNVGLVTGGIAAWSSTTGHGQTSTSWSKKRLVQVLSGVHNFLTTPFFSSSFNLLTLAREGAELGIICIAVTLSQG